MGCVSDRDQKQVSEEPPQKHELMQDEQPFKQLAPNPAASALSRDKPETSKTNQKLSLANIHPPTNQRGQSRLTSRINIAIPEGEEDRLRISKSQITGKSKLKQTGQHQWSYTKNGSTITVIDRKQAMLNSEAKPTFQSQQFNDKIVRPFSVKVLLHAKQIVRNSNYLDQSEGVLNDLQPTADVSLSDFSTGFIQTLRVPVVRTFLFNRMLTGRLSDDE